MKTIMKLLILIFVVSFTVGCNFIEFESNYFKISNNVLTNLDSAKVGSDVNIWWLNEETGESFDIAVYTIVDIDGEFITLEPKTDNDRFQFETFWGLKQYIPRFSVAEKKVYR